MLTADSGIDQTHWVAKRRKQPLPTFYYHEHFTEMLDFVARHYAHALLEPHRALIDDFRLLGDAAQCLYVRLVNRKGRVFSVKRLRYPELGEIAPLIHELRGAGWITNPDVHHFDAVVSSLSKSTLHRELQRHLVGISRSLRKADLITLAKEHCSPEDFMAHVDTEHLLVQQREDDVRYLLFLFFGRVQDGLARFTMRDLGIVRTQSFSDGYEPRFAERDQALENYYFAKRRHRLRSATATSAMAMAGEVRDWPEPNFADSAIARDKLAAEFGRLLEKLGAERDALRVYAKGESATCFERQLRLLLATDGTDRARILLERALAAPRSDEEALIAEDIYARKFGGKRTITATDELRASEVIDIDEAKSGSPERAAADFFTDRGQQAYRTENGLWRTLFGLLFWDELFVDERSRLHSPFELLPGTLQDGSFYTRHRDTIDAKLAMLDDRRAVSHALLKVSTTYYGRSNGVFRWRRRILDAMFALLQAAEPDAIRAMLRRFITDYRASRYGYPDLLIIDSAGPRFVEIKADGDQLRRNQLLRLRQLQDSGFRADVVRIRWTLDPRQSYVVVDVETTGGHGEGHRVTEIGALKIMNGKIVDRFETLLNPQRAIPATITRLTGISAAMVADAPLFSDIADDLEAFMDGAIFVAHNVDFDYRFIAREFARLGRSFRYPKLCTCASMRRLYPGHRSYSLAELCRSFDIPLTTHHRAMCDAQAAAELLLLINEKRQALLEEQAA